MVKTFGLEALNGQNFQSCLKWYNNVYMDQFVEKSDEQIASLVQNGDIDAFGALVERYEEKLKRYARKFFRDGDDAKDIIQETFIKAYSNIQGFDAERRFSPWIYRIAHNELVNALKKKKSKETVSLFDFDVFFPHLVAKETAEERAKHNEMKASLNQYLEKINLKYREPLVLYYFEDMDYKEIADVLEIPVSTVGVRLRRGKESLKKLIGSPELI
ncbi:MAG: RNA polymerase sigma factor [Spirochaetia bacterium]|nr:MAG: RNA polymerase sigma factor [Spirochaetia bacterium]